MARIIPFRAFRPPRNMVHLVASRSFVSYSRSGLSHKLSTNPYSFINIINPEIGDRKKTKSNTINRFKKVRDKYQQFIQEGTFIQDEEDSFYVYRQKFKGKIFTGIIAGASIDDYENGTIKKHEHTILKREVVFKNYLETTDMNAEPVLMTYPDDDRIKAVLEKCLQEVAEYDYMSANGACHQFWKISNTEDIQLIQKRFESFDALYIADGHHRCASSNLLGHELRRKNPDHKGTEKYNYLMSFFVPESELNILEFNRVVEDLNGLSDEEFLTKLNDFFDVTELSVTAFKPKSYNQIGMYLSGIWYALDAKIGNFDQNHPVEKLDVSILSKNILEPILGIEDLRKDKRVQFYGARNDTEMLTKLVDSGKMKVAFALHPVTIDQLKNVADMHSYMPPKSTYIEPKIRSGLALYKISD